VIRAVDDCRIEWLGQPAVSLRAPDGAAAIVLLHGAQVVSWQPAGGGERLFLSACSRFGAGEAVRGGVPVIFPQFSERGALPRHGLVRTRAWTPKRAEAGADDALAVLQITDDEATRALWPHAFALELTVCVRGDRLDVELEVTNTGDEAFDFMAALHTYLRVAEVEAARLTGLHGCNYEGLDHEDDARRRGRCRAHRRGGRPHLLRCRHAARPQRGAAAPAHRGGELRRRRGVESLAGEGRGDGRLGAGRFPAFSVRRGSADRQAAAARRRRAMVGPADTDRRLTETAG